MVYSEKELNDNEEIILNLRPHWWFFAKQGLVLVLSLIFALGILALQFDSSWVSILGVIPFIIAFFWFLARYLVWINTRFVVTSDRLTNRSGVLNRQGVEIPLERVNTVFFSQSIFERIIGSGDLVIESAGEQGQQKFSDIKRPLNVQNEIHRQMESNENRKFDRVSQGIAETESNSKLSIPEQIDQLDDLRRREVISNEEFESKKEELLKRM